MNYGSVTLEILVVLVGLGVLLVDLWAPPDIRRKLGYGAAGALGLILLLSFSRFIDTGTASVAFGGMFAQDGVALFFKRFFLVAVILVLVMSVDFADRIQAGTGEYYAVITFAAAGMMLAASVNDFAFLFVAVELITVTFYVLTSFQRSRVTSLEAGVKYLILSGTASAFLVYGIALVYGVTGTMNFDRLSGIASEHAGNRLFQVGLLLVLGGLAFKIAAFPMQMWAPDVYQGAPTPSTAFLAVGSKAAGFVLLLRVLYTAVPDVAPTAARLFMLMAGLTILYGNLCAIPQRNLKRLLGYSSIANAGYLLLGVAAMSPSGQSAVLFYLAVYLFSVLGAFLVICLVSRQEDSEDIGALAGLGQRAPLLAVTLTLSMVSLAGIPPLAGFVGKFLLFKAVVEKAGTDPAYWALLGVALVGVTISLYYYFGIVRAIYWSKETVDSPRDIQITPPMRAALYVCAGGMLFFGLFPGPLLDVALRAVQAF
jgi:NADH-quinone oxidoreductase subunit N